VQILDTFTRDDEYCYFDGYGFQVQNGNMTIDNFFTGERLVMLIDGDSGQTSTTKVTGKDRPVEVTGATTWDFVDGTLTITVDHSSQATVEVVYQAGGGGNGGDTPENGGGGGGFEDIIDRDGFYSPPLGELGVWVLALLLGVVVVGGMIRKGGLKRFVRKPRGYKGRKKKR